MAEQEKRTEGAKHYLSADESFGNIELDMQKINSFNFIATQSLMLSQVRFTNEECEDMFMQKVITAQINKLFIYNCMSPHKLYKLLYFGNMSQTLVKVHLFLNLNLFQSTLLAKALRNRDEKPFDRISIGQPNMSVARAIHPCIYGSIGNVKRLVVNHLLKKVDCLCLVRNTRLHSSIMAQLKMFSDFQKTLDVLSWKLPLYLVQKMDAEVVLHFFNSALPKQYFVAPAVVEYMKIISGKCLKMEGCLR